MEPVIAPVLFDTLRYAKRLQEIGFPREQAEGFAELQREIVDERLATKADIRRLEAELEVKFKELDAKIDTVAKEFDAKIEFTAKNLEYKLTVRLGSMMAASVVIVAALVKLL
jgi:DNA-binding transcriptional MerR regulator